VIFELWTILRDYLRAGGYVMPALVVATLVLWFTIGYRASVLRGSGAADANRVLRMARDGLLKNPRNALERAVTEAVALAARQPPHLRRLLDERLIYYRHELSRYDVGLKAVVAVAPILGLLGTVTGMIETFASLNEMALYTQSGGIAGGISQALFTTQLGLAIAIPGLILRGALERRQRSIVTNIERVRDILCGSQP
jgi:biopolymer transport protein ExbB